MATAYVAWDVTEKRPLNVGVFTTSADATSYINRVKAKRTRSMDKATPNLTVEQVTV